MALVTSALGLGFKRILLRLVYLLIKLLRVLEADCRGTEKTADTDTITVHLNFIIYIYMLASHYP